MKLEHQPDESRTLTVYWHIHDSTRDHQPDRGDARLSQVVGRDVATHRQVAWKACVYALFLSLFFLIFGTLILRLFGVPLAMVRIVGGIILVKIGFELFAGSSSEGIVTSAAAKRDANIAFVPLAMPLMCGPGAIATILGMTSTVRQSPTELASFFRRRGSNSRHHARDVLVSDLCGQAFREIGFDGD